MTPKSPGIALAALREVLAFTGPRRARQALVYLALIGVGSAWVTWRHFDPAPPMGPLLHERYSLEIALTQALCGKRSALNTSLPVTGLLIASASARRMPLRDVAIIASSGSQTAYCSSTLPTVNHENSLMLLTRFWLRLNPSLSLAGLARLNLCLELAAFLAFLFVLLECGASMALSVGTTVSFLGLLKNLESSSYAQYALLAPAILLAAAIYAWGVRHIDPRNWIGVLCLTAVMGVYSGFSTNIRTSYAPIYLAFFTLFALAVTRGLRPTAPRMRLALQAGGMAAAFLLSWAAFSLAVVRPLAAQAQGFTHHVVGHSLVLSLALPTNELSTREGIEWRDEVGLTLAQRVDPSAGYLSPSYERALLRYYFGLWRSDPKGMGRVYQAKLKLAGRHMVRYIGVKLTAWQPWFEAVFLPLKRLPNGGFLLLAYALVGIGSGIAFLRRGGQLSFLLLLMSIAAVLLHCESVIILPHFNVAYHGYLLFHATFLILLAYQGILQAFVYIGARQPQP
jgi:hypothetical protein